MMPTTIAERESTASLFNVNVSWNRMSFGGGRFAILVTGQDRAAEARQARVMQAAQLTAVRQSHKSSASLGKPAP